MKFPASIFVFGSLVVSTLASAGAYDCRRSEYGTISSVQVEANSAEEANTINAEWASEGADRTAINCYYIGNNGEPVCRSIGNSCRPPSAGDPNGDGWNEACCPGLSCQQSRFNGNYYCLAD